MKIKVEMDWPEAKWEWDYAEQCWKCSHCGAVYEKEIASRLYLAFCHHCGYHMTLEKPTAFYECDPEKNIYCSKESCYINGGGCEYTCYAEYAKDRRPVNEDIILLTKNMEGRNNGSNSN